MLVCAGLTAAGFAIVLVALPETAQLSGREIRLEAGSVLSLPRQLTRAWQSSGALLAADRGLMTAAWLLLITQFASIGIVLSTVSLLLQQRFGESLDLGSLALGVGSASGILLGLRSALASVTGPLAGRLSDRDSGRRPVIAGALALGILGFGTLFVARSLEVIVLGVALGALSDGAALAALTAYMGDLTPPGRQGIAMGAFATAGDIGTTAGPFLAFALASTVDLRWIYLLCTLAFLVGLWLIWRV
jgi:MFS family permease